MIERGLCTILASDYYYPAQLFAAFRLAADGIAPLTHAWTLISQAPAAAAGLGDRGRIAEGCRADLVLIDPVKQPRVVATIAAGHIVHLTEGHRLLANN
jgi:alpha-D-ribose 1-methylphosphonate 5-triphosphate diphosphatase